MHANSVRVNPLASAHAGSLNRSAQKIQDACMILNWFGLARLPQTVCIASISIHNENLSHLYLASLSMRIILDTLLGACKDLDAVELCSFSETTCEAVFITNGKTCDSHCDSMGLECDSGWEITSKNCNSRVPEDPSRSRNGCGKSLGSQICRCSVGNCKLTLIGFRQDIDFNYLKKIDLKKKIFIYYMVQ